QPTAARVACGSLSHRWYRVAVDLPRRAMVVGRRSHLHGRHYHWSHPMHLIHLLLPLYDNDCEPLPKALFAEVRNELMQQFGGLTAHTRAPANGLWQDD